MIYSRLVTQTDAFTILTVKWNLKQTQHFRLLLIHNVALCMKNTMEPIQPVTVSLELVFLRKTMLKSKLSKKSVCFQLKEKKRPLFSTGWDRNTQEELTTIKGKDAYFLTLIYKNCDMTLLRMVFYCCLCINFCSLLILMIGERSFLYTTKR